MAVFKSDSAKRLIMRILGEQGYPTYARLLNLFDVYLTDDPKVVGYMLSGKALIVLNKELDIEQISTIVRHEMLHEWLNHGVRKLKYDKENSIEQNSLIQDIANVAADYEISNRGYTEKDKDIARSIKLGDEILKGLVTEDKYPGWENMSFEDMYKELLERNKEDREALKELIDALNKLNQQNLKELEDAIKEQLDLEQSQSQQLLQSQSQSQQSQSQPQDSQSQSQAQSQGQDDKDEDLSLNQTLKKLEKEVQKASQELKDLEKNLKNPIPTEKEQDKKEDLAERVSQIKKAFEDVKKADQARGEVTRQKQIEKQKKIQSASDRMGRDPLYRFKLNLRNFIANQVEEEEEETYSRVNPSYEDSEFILPGKKEMEVKYIPVINVYHDTSGSFTSFPQKQRMVDAAIASILKYADDGDIEIKRYYHADRVSPTREGAGNSNNGNRVMEHILATKPDNVIITTDGDLSNTSISATVPGAVWMLFFGERSQGLIDNLKGKKETKVYDIRTIRE